MKFATTTILLSIYTAQINAKTKVLGGVHHHLKPKRHPGKDDTMAATVRGFEGMYAPSGPPKEEGDTPSPLFHILVGDDDVVSGVVTENPTATPSTTPSSTPSTTPSATPSTSPSNTPSTSPSSNPSVTPSVNPSSTPSSAPVAKTFSPTQMPSSSPSLEATTLDTKPPPKNAVQSSKSTGDSKDDENDEASAGAETEEEEVRESTTLFLFAGVFASAVAAGGLMYRRRCRSAAIAELPDDITIFSTDSVHNLGIQNRGPIVHIGGKYGVEFDGTKGNDRALHEV